MFLYEMVIMVPVLQHLSALMAALDVLGESSHA